MRRCSIANAHGSVSFKARPGAQDALVRECPAIDAVQRCWVQIRRAGGDIEQELNELLALLEVTEQAKGTDRVVRIPQPAVTIVPGASAAGASGAKWSVQRRWRQCLQTVQLERQRRADHPLPKRRIGSRSASPRSASTARCCSESARTVGPMVLHGSPQLSTRWRRSVSANACSFR